MNKKKWVEKSKDLQNFEEQTLISVRKRFEKYNIELEKLGLVLDIDLIWWCYPEEPTYTRIEFKEGYVCDLGFQVRRNNEPMHDLDLIAITYSNPITKIRMEMFRWGLRFSKIKEKYLQEYLNSVEELLSKVFKFGYDSVLLELKNNS